VYRLPPKRDRKNKSPLIPSMPVLSAPHRGIFAKNNGRLDIKMGVSCYETLSVLSVPYGGMFAKNNGRLDTKMGVSCYETLSVLSVPYGEVSIKFERVKNILKSPYTRTDNTDSVILIERVLKPIDLYYFFNKEGNKRFQYASISVASSRLGVCFGINGKNILKAPYIQTDNTDSVICIVSWRNYILLILIPFLKMNQKRVGECNE
jgi:hypothetical protein